MKKETKIKENENENERGNDKKRKEKETNENENEKGNEKKTKKKKNNMKKSEEQRKGFEKKLLLTISEVNFEGKAPHATEFSTLSPLDAALTMRFAENTQRDTSEVLRVLPKMMMEVSKVPRLPQKMQLIF